MESPRFAARFPADPHDGTVLTMRRRQFHQSLVFSALAGSTLAHSSLAASPSDRVRVAFIGTGNQGMGLLKRFLQADLGQVVAVCDVNEGSLGYKQDDHFYGREPARKFVDNYYQKHHPQFEKCAAYLEHERVLERDDIDAVIIVTPDHSHRHLTIDAAESGKDVYCEKPLAYSVLDGEAMLAAIRKHNRICQTGSQERSNPVARFICEAVKAGKIGEVKRVETVVGYNNKVSPGPGWKPMPVPPTFDYERWLGPAPRQPYHQDRCLYRFRFNYDYAGGQIANFGAHSNDMALWGLGLDDKHPETVQCLGAKFLEPGSLFTTATETDFECQLPGGVTLRCTTGPEAMQAKFIGSDGWIRTGYGGTEASDPSLLDGVPEMKDARGWDPHTLHMENFISCVRTRDTPRADVAIGNNSSVVGNLANIAIRRFAEDGDTLYRWNQGKLAFENSNVGNSMLGQA